MMGRRAVFLDLQGTLGGEPYGDISSFSFFPNAKRALVNISDAGYMIFIVTNQSRIAKGIISKADFETKAEEICQEVSGSGVRIEKIYCCPHRKEDGCKCRKPLPYFLECAGEEYGIDMKNSICIGDIYHSDVEMARNVGARAILVQTGKGKDSLLEMEKNPYERATVAKDILEASLILKKEVDT